MTDTVYVISGASDPGTLNPVHPTIGDAITAAQSFAGAAEAAADAATEAADDVTLAATAVAGHLADVEAGLDIVATAVAQVTTLAGDAETARDQVLAVAGSIDEVFIATQQASTTASNAAEAAEQSAEDAHAAQILLEGGPVGSVNGKTGIVVLVPADIDAAPLESPGFTGAPTAVTPSNSENSTRLATTAYVKTLLSALVNGAGASLDQLNEIAAALNNDANFAATMMAALGGKQASHVNLTALAGLAGAASKLPGFTGAGAMALLTYGTSGNNVLLQLDAAGKLPALDASALLNITAVPKALVLSKSANYTVLAADAGKLIECTASLTLALTAAATLGDGFTFYVRVPNLDNFVTIDPAGAELIDGLATARGYAGDNLFTVVCNGTSFRTSRVRGMVLIGRTTISTAVAALDREIAFDDPELAEMRFLISGLSHAYTPSATILRGLVKKSGAYQTASYLDRSLGVAGGSNVSASSGDFTLSGNIAHTALCSGVVSVINFQATTAGVQIIKHEAIDNDAVNSNTHLSGQCLITNTGAIQGLRLLSGEIANLDAGTITQYAVRG